MQFVCISYNSTPLPTSTSHHLPHHPTTHLGRFEDHSISSSQACSHLPGEHHKWVVPRCYYGHHSVKCDKYLLKNTSSNDQ